MSAGLLAVLWDLDGTLADSEPFHQAATVAALRTFGIAAEHGDDLLGVDREGVHAHLVSKYGAMPDLATYSTEVDRQFASRVSEVPAITPALAAMRRFHAQGRPQFVVSNGTGAAVSQTLAAIGADRLIAGSIHADGAGQPKPHPDPYRRGLAALGRAAATAIAVEDSAVGCRAARAAGLFTVGVPQDGGTIGADAHYPEFPDIDPEEIVATHG